MKGDLRERGGLQPEKLGHLVQSPGKPGKGLEKPAGWASLGALWSAWLLLYEAAWVRGERGSGWACGWGPLRGAWEGLISRGLTRVEIRPERFRKDTTQVWDANNRLWHPGPEALVQRGRSSRLTLHPCKAVPVTGPDGGVWAEEVKGQGGGRTDWKPEFPCLQCTGTGPRGMVSLPGLACGLSHWPYRMPLRLLNGCASRRQDLLSAPSPQPADAASKASVETRSWTPQGS